MSRKLFVLEREIKNRMGYEIHVRIRRDGREVEQRHVILQDGVGVRRSKG